MITPDFLTELQRFHLIVNKKVTSKYVGEQKSFYQGGGTIFKEHRIYAVGDNFKQIDWKVYGRTDDLYIKVYEEERNLEVHILLDKSASMRLGSKWDYAGMIGVGMAFLAQQNNERVHFAMFSNQMDLFRGRKGRGQVMSMIDSINDTTPSGRTNFYTSLQHYKRFITSRSLIVIISDFMTPFDVLEKALPFIAKGHMVKLVQILDVIEANMPLEGDFKFIDSESDVVLRTFVSKRSAKNFVDNLQQHAAKIKALANDLRIDFYQFDTSKPLFDSFFDLVSV